MCDRTLAIYCFTDDFLKTSRHREDCRIEVTNAEIITIAITAMLHFGGNKRMLAPYAARTRFNDVWQSAGTFQTPSADRA
jgi:hypothetical protein